jgi:hypothetical protein
MSAFVLVLAAGMAIGDGGPRISATVVPPPPVKPFAGVWRGTVYWGGRSCEVEVRDGAVENKVPADVCQWPCKLAVDGPGTARQRFNGATLLAIYKWEHDRLFVCVSQFPAESGGKRPTSFAVTDETDLYVLRPVPPGTAGPRPRQLRK